MYILMGFIYLLETYNTGVFEYKIGYTSKNVNKRIKELQTGNATDLELVYTFETKHNQKLERTLHRYYQYRNIRGEWFQLTREELNLFPDRCKKVERNLDLIQKELI